MKLLLSFLALIFAFPALSATFIDAGDFPTWAEDPIEQVYEAGIMTGYGDGSFGPEKLLTRAEVVTLILRTKADIVMQNYNGIPQFPDVAKGTWYEDAIGVAAAYGWVQGHDDGNFYPGDHLTRAEFATLLQRVFGIEADDPLLALKYEDINNEALWYAEPVSAMLEHDLLRNALNLNFRPGNEVSRAEAAWTFAQLVEKPGLTGHSAEAGLASTDPLDSRRVAIKPRDFDANDQGYEVEREALHLEAVPSQADEFVDFNIDSDWTSLGLIRIRNTFDYRADLESLSLRLRLDATDMGPAEAFLLRIEGPEILSEKKVFRNGELTLTGLDLGLSAGDEIVLKVAIKPDVEESFYMKVATGKVFVTDAGGEAFKPLVSENRERDVRIAPIEFTTRDLANFQFDPFPEE